MHVVTVSTLIVPILRSATLKATVHSVFAEAANLVSEDGNWFSVVSDKIGNGPLNAVVDHEAVLALLRQGEVVSGDGRWLDGASGVRLDMTAAETWNPYLALDRLACWPGVVRENLRWLRTALPLEAPSASLASAPAYHTQGAFGSRPAIALVQSQAWELIEGLERAYEQGNRQWLMLYARRLAGLGPGLTPAGDDWLAGWMLGLHARAALADARDDEQPAPLSIDTVGELIVRAAQGQTNNLSLAFLSAAAAGAASAPWHTLIQALSEADPVHLQQAATELMTQGATSGADSLAGFLAALKDY